MLTVTVRAKKGGSALHSDDEDDTRAVEQVGGWEEKFFFFEFISTDNRATAEVKSKKRRHRPHESLCSRALIAAACGSAQCSNVVQRRRYVIECGAGLPNRRPRKAGEDTQSQ